MARRSYNQNCVLARAGDVIGERWTLLLLRELLISPRRYNALLESLRGIGTNLLAARLRELEDAGIVERRDSGRRSHVYALTESGRALEPTVLELIRWSMLYGPPNQPGDYHRNDWDLLALKALFQPQLAEGLAITVQFQADDFEGWVRLENEEMHIGIGDAADADVVVNGNIPELLLGRRSPDEMIIRGELKALRRFLSAFAA